MKPASLLAVVALVLVLMGCSAPLSMVRGDGLPIPLVLYSDEQYAALKSKRTTIDDLASSTSNSQLTTLAALTKVEVLGSEQVPIASDVAAPVPWTFHHVRVASGVGVGHEGWVSAVRFWDSTPTLEPVPAR